MQSRAHPAVSSPTKDFTLTGRKCKSTGVSFVLLPQYDLKEAPVHHVDCQTLCESLWYLISRFSLHACFPTSCSSAQVASVSDSSCLYLRFCLFVCFFSPLLRQGAPVVVSFPHFYQADPKYINAVDGLNPNKEEHETYLDLQPVGIMTRRGSVRRKS